MGLIVVFFMGIANFALHKAVLNSGHPLLAQMPLFFRTMGGRFSLIVEFTMLLGALLLASQGAGNWVWFYAGYSAVNAASAWLILTGRI